MKSKLCFLNFYRKENLVETFNIENYLFEFFLFYSSVSLSYFILNYLRKQFQLISFIKVFKLNKKIY